MKTPGIQGERCYYFLKPEFVPHGPEKAMKQEHDLLTILIVAQIEIALLETRQFQNVYSARIN